MEKVKYLVDTDDSIDSDVEIRVQDGGVANIYHNGKNFITEYYQNRCTEKEVDWEKLAEGKKYLTDWDAQILDVNEEMIKDALDWLFVSTQDFEFVKVDTVEELFN